MALDSDVCQALFPLALILFGDGNLLMTSNVAQKLEARGFTDLSLLQGDLDAARAASESAGAATASISKRLELAKTLLIDNSDLSVAEVAYSCGFATSQYFSTVFKKQEKCTPLEYKSRILQGALDD